MAGNDKWKERFSKLEEQVSVLTKLVTKLVEGAASKSTPKKVSASSSKQKHGQKSKAYSDEEEVEQTKVSLLDSFQSGKDPFQVDFKLEIPIFDSAINAEKLDNWIDQLENYFIMHGYTSAQKIKFARLELIWWNAYLKRYDVSELT